MRSTILKLYAANFFIGLVFWYGIEKLFMQSLGINAVGIGIVIAVFLGFTLFFDIPAGILADRWSRKGTLILSMLAMIVCCLILGSANNLLVYVIGYGIFYGLYAVGTSGTVASILYDVLYEHGKSEHYSKIMGRTYAFYLAGIATANIVSGFLSNLFNFRVTYFVTIASCLIAMGILVFVKEPTFHKKEQKERILRQLGSVTKTILRSRMIYVLILIMAALTIIQVFKNDFGQLYIVRYISEPQFMGLLWAAGALSWAAGNLIAHHFKSRLTTLVVLSVLPLILMSFIDNWFSLVLFMIQQAAMAALFNQIETRVQDATPSGVRTSILSILSSLGRLVSMPVSILIGWIISHYDVFIAQQFVAAIAALALVYWLWQRYVRHAEDKAVIVE